MKSSSTFKAFALVMGSLAWLTCSCLAQTNRPLRIESMALQDGIARLSVSGVPGSGFVIETSSDEHPGDDAPRVCEACGESAVSNHIRKKQNDSLGDSTMTRQNEDIDAIKQLANDWRSGWLAGDADSLLSLYADDPVLMPQGQPAVFGKDAIRSLYQPVLKEFAFKSQAKLMEVEASGDWGYFWSTYTLTATPKAGGEPFEDEGKSVFIVKRELGGAWKIARLIDNSDRAPTSSQ
jgi:uncharacterized protein (TIGR02246 family)